MNARSFLLLACCALAPGLACTAPRAPVAAPPSLYPYWMQARFARG